MGLPAAKKGDQIVATDVHIILVPTGPSVTPTPTPMPFAGTIDNGLSTDVNIMGSAAAVLGSTATNAPSHIPTGGSFASPPKNQGRIIAGSATVLINNKPAARSSDQALTCNDPTDLPSGTVVAAGTVLIG
jgi:uncharacterized Zn-binding protein involved in type VI secretion